MKLFLCSTVVSAAQLPTFLQLSGAGKPQDIKLGLIENAADGEEGDKTWMLDTRRTLAAHGFTLDNINLQDYTQDNAGLSERLAACNVIWIGGGNTFYLRWILRQTGADKIIKKLVQQGTVYAGGSAGAIVAGPTLQYFDSADDASAAPELIWDGLKLTDSVVVPHFGNPAFDAVCSDIANNLEADGYSVVRLTDAQALVIDDEEAPEII
ncbi:MAG TPA: Type 1 glutamine amidotransferase-like domain-containing protein [Candidatus Saccharimonadales bacterium]|nr:Type 1 glutamine amidotransferase-like domain-containing protein [Candidatus Saccharimonadales bacterium]